MCTLIILYKLIKDYPIIALHNRYLGKDTIEYPPNRSSGVISPLDVASKGTWIGFNRKGLLVAITNQETETLEKPGRSRGLLALDILRDCASAEEAKKLLLEPETRTPYRSGNFVVLDANTGHHIVWDVDTYHFDISPGLYPVGTVTVVPGVRWSERSLRIYEGSEKRVTRARELLNEYKPKDIDDAVETLMKVSADHACGRTESSICWHHPDFKQTSSTIMAVGSKPRVYYCLGNHCESPYTDYSNIVH
jgi:uncharacterized protein with NRDE domain